MTNENKPISRRARYLKYLITILVIMAVAAIIVVVVTEITQIVIFATETAQEQSYEELKAHKKNIAFQECYEMNIHMSNSKSGLEAYCEKMTSVVVLP